jgi:hypothetical protein
MIIPGVVAGGQAAAASGYTASAVTVPLGTFITSDNLVAVDSRLGLISVWVRPVEGQGAFMVTRDGGFWAIATTVIGSDLRVLADFWDTTNSVDFAFNTTVPLAELGEWTNILFAVDTNHAAGQKVGLITVDRVSRVVTVAADAADAFDIGWSQDAASTAIRGMPQSLADPYVAMGQFADVSTLTAMNKFSDTDNKPIDLGADGSLPTGTAPTMFFSGNAASFATNKGTGGAFTASGDPITNAATSPSD